MDAKLFGMAPLATGAGTSGAATEVRLAQIIGQLKVKELKDLLAQIGLTKGGRKDALVNRLAARLRSSAPLAPGAMALLQDPAYQRLAAALHALPGAASAGYGTGQRLGSAPQAVPRASCPCGNPYQGTSTVRCAACGAQHHAGCVGSSSPDYLCELCRLEEVDPMHRRVDGVNAVTMLFQRGYHGAETATAHRQLALPVDALQGLRQGRYVARIYCLELHPPAQANRYPVSLDLRVNHVPVHVPVPLPTWDPSTGRYRARPMDQICSLPSGTPWSPVSAVAVTVTAQQPCVVVLRICEPRTVAETCERVLADNPLTLEGSQEAAKRKYGFDGPEDDDLVPTAVKLTLACPITQTRIREPARSALCMHLECFDLAVFIEMNCTAKAPRWECPICSVSARPKELVVDLWLKSLIAETEAKQLKEVLWEPDGTWKEVPQPGEKPRAKRQRPGPAVNVASDAQANGAAGSSAESAPTELQAPADAGAASSAPPPPFGGAAGPAAATPVYEAQDAFPWPPAVHGLRTSAGLEPLPTMAMPGVPPPAMLAVAVAGANRPVSGVTRQGVTPQDMSRVVSDACRAVQVMGQGMAFDGPPELHPAYKAIRSLFLSLEQAPESPDAQGFAHQMACTLIRADPASLAAQAAECSLVQQPAASPPPRMPQMPGLGPGARLPPAGLSFRGPRTPSASIEYARGGAASANALDAMGMSGLLFPDLRRMDATSGMTPCGLALLVG